MTGANRIWARLFPLLLFAGALAARLTISVGRRPQWVRRGAFFFESLSDGRLADTAFTGHPGVTVMWLAGAGRMVLGWFRPDALTAPFLTADEASSVSVAEMIAGMIPLALVISLIVVAIYFALLRLADPLTAGAAAAFIAFDPQQIVASGIVHPDALLSVLVPLGTLTVVVAALDAGRNRRWLIFSGVVAGLALLTKLPALVLLPLAGLAFAAAALTSVPRNKPTAPLRGLVSAAASLSLWALTAAATFVALWPAMWVRPLEALGRIYQLGIARHALPGANVHKVMFFGQLVESNPGWGFYFYASLIRLTAVTFVFALVGMALLFPLAARRSERRAVWTGAAILVCLGGFFLGINLALDKEDRYGLTLLPLIDILAGLGLVWWAGAVAGRLTPRRTQLVSLGLTAAFVSAHVALVLAHWPYPAITGNDVFGGTRAADYVLGLGLHGEGIRDAVEYVNGLPDSERLRVDCRTLSWICQRYARFSMERDGKEHPPDYLIYARTTLIRGNDELPRGPQPLTVIWLSGVPFAWVYAGDADERSDLSLPPADYGAPSAASFRLTPAGGAALLLAAAGMILGLRRPTRKGGARAE